MIQIENLSKTYYRGKLNIMAIRDISCGIVEGEVFSVVGRSGSGKSTLLNQIGGLDKATSGHIIRLADGRVHGFCHSGKSGCRSLSSGPGCPHRSGESPEA